MSLTPLELRIPLVKCPRCHWARGGLSVDPSSERVELHLWRWLAAHMGDAHGVDAAQLELPLRATLQPEAWGVQQPA